MFLSMFMSLFIFHIFVNSKLHVCNVFRSYFSTFDAFHRSDGRIIELSRFLISYFFRIPLINNIRPMAMMINGHRIMDSIPKNLAPPKTKNKIKLIETNVRLADKPSGFSFGEISVANAMPTPTKPGIKDQANDQVSQLPVRF